MRVLVTGHKGYIGTVLVKVLLEAGHEVTGLDSDLYRRCTFGGDGIQSVPELEKDIRSIEMKDLDTGYDAVIHLAGLSNDPLGDLDPELTHEINYLATVRFAKLAKSAGIPKFIFSSSCSNYGAGGDELLNEESEFRPVTPYGVSKVKVEQDVAKLGDSKFCPTFLRNATAYGVSPRLRFDLVLNNLVAWAFTTKRIFIKSDGTPWRPIVHIEDISRAFLAVLEAPKEIVYNQAFNVGRNEDNFRVRDLAQIVEETVPGCRIEYSKDAGPDKRCYRVDCSKIRRTLPTYRPRWNARRGAKELYQAYQRIGLSLEEFEGPKYKRVTHIQHLIQAGHLDHALRWNGNHKHKQ